MLPETGVGGEKKTTAARLLRNEWDEIDEDAEPATVFFRCRLRLSAQSLYWL